MWILVVEDELAIAKAVRAILTGTGHADDDLAKPFAAAELLARVRARLRRGSVAAPSRLLGASPVLRVIRVGHLELDPATFGVRREDFVPAG